MKIFITLLFLCLIRHSNAQSKSEYVLIIEKFLTWKSQQIKKGTYASDKNCNPTTVSKESYKGSSTGISSDIQTSFADINGDQRIDAIVTFNPFLCDGGNALMNAQIRVLILSKGTSYYTDDTYIDKIEKQYKDGWLNIERASEGTFFGTYYEYKEDDGRCCPSIKKRFTIDYKTKKLVFTDGE